jgi:hypothetical protein
LLCGQLQLASPAVVAKQLSADLQLGPAVEAKFTKVLQTGIENYL